MKNFRKMMAIAALAVVIAAGMSAEALAVGTDQETQAAAEAAAPEETPAAAEAAPGTDSNDISTELQDAMKAYRDAKKAAQGEDLKADLDAYVAAGSMTREQADLILKYYNEQEALQNGVCPNCGYEFQFANGGKGGMHMRKGGDFAGNGSSFDDSGNSGEGSGFGGRGMHSGKGKGRG